MIHLSRSLAFRWRSGGLCLHPLFWLCRHSDLWCFEWWTLFATFTLNTTIPHRWVLRTPVEQLQPFEGARIVGCRKLDGYIDESLHMLRTIYPWCVASFSRGLWNITTHIEQVLDGRVVQTHVKIEALCEQRWPNEQHPGKKSGHMLHLLRHQGTLGTVCLHQDSDHVCLWPSYYFNHDTARHGYSGVVEESTGKWNGALLSSVMRVGSVCMLMMDVNVYGVDLVSVIFRSAFTHNSQAPPQTSWRGGHQLQLTVTFGVSAGWSKQCLVHCTCW